MTNIKIIEVQDDLAQNLILGVTTEGDGLRVVSNITDDSFIEQVASALATVRAKGSALATTRIVSPADPTKIVIAVGVADDVTSGLRQMAATGVRSAAGLEDVTIAFDHDKVVGLESIVEGIGLGSYVFSEYRAPKDQPVSNVCVATSVHADSKAIVSRADIVYSATNRVRDLVNTAPNHLSPAGFAAIAEAEAKEAGCKVKVYEEKDLQKENLAGLLHVGAGSANGPRLVRIEWNPSKAKGFSALVGKGITFDSGGYSLKPATAMTEMKTDMAGAATVLQTVIALAKLKVARKVVAWLCLAENMVSGNAGRPDDVITYRNGKSVEINNTDAEGRLVMADGLIMACEENPDEVIDIATLTGAQMVALGNQTTGIMGTESVREQLCASADAVGEPAWPMPLPKHLRSSLDSDIADLKNSGSRFGGMLVAGLFLKEFVNDTPWAHIDIAGPSFNRESAAGEYPKGATGAMTRTLIAHLEGSRADA